MALTVLPLTLGIGQDENSIQDFLDRTTYTQAVQKFRLGVDSLFNIESRVPVNLSGTITAVKVRFSVAS